MNSNEPNSSQQLPPTPNSSGMKTEIKAEVMDHCDNNSADGKKKEINDTKDECTDESMSPADSKMKIEKRSTIPEPIKQDSSEKDKKKKCRKLLCLYLFVLFPFCGGQTSFCDKKMCSNSCDWQTLYFSV